MCVGWHHPHRSGDTKVMPREFSEGNNLSRIAKYAGDYWRLSVTASNFLRPAHNLKVVGSNPAPATNFRPGDSRFRAVFVFDSYGQFLP
jgi:hypothetical protein